MSTSTEHPPAAIGEKVHLKDVTEAVAKAESDDASATEGDDGTAPHVPGDSTGQQSAETVQVEAENINELIEKGFEEPSMLTRRRVVNEKVYPWRTIGKVIVGQGDRVIRIGSGVLVGKNLILTAGHVAPWGKSNAWMRFIPAFKNGATPFGSAYVEKYYGYHREKQVFGLDYVICKLNRPLGSSVGWMGSKSFGSDRSYYNGVWTSVGYPIEPANPNAMFMIVEEKVKIVDVDDEGSEGKELETHVFSLDGWSGGPLWAFFGRNDPRVIGIMSGNETDFLQPRHSVSAGGLAMVKLVRYGIAKWS